MFGAGRKKQDEGRRRMKQQDYRWATLIHLILTKKNLMGLINKNHLHFTSGGTKAQWRFFFPPRSHGE